MSEPDDEPPRALRSIAFLFRAEGVLAVLSIAAALADRRLHLALGILGFWIAPGLLRGDRTWRAWALAFTIVQTLAMAFATVILLLTDVPVNVRVFGQDLSHVPRWTVLLLTVPVAFVGAWRWWVLMRPAVRRRFVPEEYAPGPEPRLRAIPAPAKHPGTQPR